MKRMSWFFGAMVVSVMALTGCSSEEKSEKANTASTKGNLTVQGSVSSKLGTDNARAVAIGENGKKIWTYLDKHGDFSLKLPTGQAYRVVIANQLPTGGQKVIGKLAVKNGKAATDVIEAKKTGKIDLGVLRKPEAKAATKVTTKSLHVSCGCENDNGGGGDWGGGGDDMGGGDWGGDMGGDGGWGDDSGWGDWGGGDEGGWDDAKSGNWGGASGWEGDYGEGGWDDEATGGWDNGGDIDPSQFDHDDDNGCFDEDGGTWGDESGWDGADGADGKMDPAGMGDVDPCDICVAGDPIDLVPSKGGYGDFVKLGGELDPFEGQSCATFTPKKPISTTASADAKDTSSSKEGIVGKSASKKDVGEKCVSKADVDTSVNMCVAGQVVKK